MNKDELISFIKSALKEDLPQGDLTTDSLNLGARAGHAKLIAKSPLVLSGAQIFEATVRLLDPNAALSWKCSDGERIEKNQVVCEIQADLPLLLKAERVALNLLGHLSGIASLTHQFVSATQLVTATQRVTATSGHVAITNFRTKILDTRKTLPLYRDLEKKAVRDGGGTNHRMNLSDAILIKENHIRAAGGIQSAVFRVKASTRKPIEIETRNLEEVKEAVSAGVQRILLDNMSTEEMRSCLKFIPQGVQTEASGNMTLERIPEVAALGVDFISVGALTHSAPCSDLSLMFDWETAKVQTSQIRSDLSEWTVSWCSDKNIEWEFFHQISSTNDWAKSSFQKKPYGNTGLSRLILADHQSGGRGRHRTEETSIWEDVPGASLLSTWCYDLKVPPQPILAPLIGLALFKAAKVAWPQLDWSLKAPNDLYIGPRKLGGILAEIISRSPQSFEVFVGIGLNVFAHPADLPAGDISHSLGRKVERPEWLTFASSLFENLNEAIKDGEKSFLSGAARDQLKTALNKFSGKAAEVIQVRSDGSIETAHGIVSWSEI